VRCLQQIHLPDRNCDVYMHVIYKDEMKCVFVDSSRGVMSDCSISFKKTYLNHATSVLLLQRDYISGFETRNATRNTAIERIRGPASLGGQIALLITQLIARLSMCGIGVLR